MDDEILDLLNRSVYTSVGDGMINPQGSKFKVAPYSIFTDNPTRHRVQQLLANYRGGIVDTRNFNTKMSSLEELISAGKGLLTPDKVFENLGRGFSNAMLPPFIEDYLAGAMAQMGYKGYNGTPKY